MEVLYCPADIMEQESESPMSPTSDHGAANINIINNNNNFGENNNKQNNTTPTPDQIPPQQVTASGVEAEAQQRGPPPMVPALQLQRGNLDKSALEQESQAEQSREGIPSLNPDSDFVQPFVEQIAYQDNRTSTGSGNDVIENNNNNIDESSVPRVSPFGDYNLTSSSSGQVNSINTTNTTTTDTSTTTSPITIALNITITIGVTSTRPISSNSNITINM